MHRIDMSINQVNVHGTHFLDGDDRELYRQKLARITLDSMMQLVGLLDANGTVLDINKVALEAAGIELCEIEGRPFWTTFWWQVSTEVNAVLREGIARAAAGEHVRWETAICDRPGGQPTLIIDASLKPVKDEQGRVVFIAVEGRDITARKAQGQIDASASRAPAIAERGQVEQSLRDADRRKDEFLATLAHELRNPLAPIRNAIELLKLADVTDQRVLAARDIVDRQVRHMVRLVDDLLEVSRIALGHVTLRKANVSLHGVLADALEAAGPAIEAGRHALSVQLPADVLRVSGDPTRLSQIFQNLLNNAAKYTPAGGQIDLRSKRVGNEVVVSVRDNGIGIPPELQPRVFELFTRVHKDHAIKTSGLGIGLALARELITLHGGRLELRSEGANAGSEFIATLPLSTVSTLPAERDSTFRTSGEKTRRILIVDDNQDSANSLAMLLEADSHTTQVAFDGLAALALAESFEPDVVILDIGLPDIDGYEVSRRLRSTARGKVMKLVALTGWGQSEDRRRSLEAGFDHHLTKPVAFESLDIVLSDDLR